MKRILIFILLIVFSTLALQAAPLTIKIGSLTPTGSDWDDCIKEIASEWKRISNGEVIVKLYSGGIAGDEAEMLRKIKLGQLHAAGISGVGINYIYKGTLALSMPLLIQTDAEFEYVLDKMRPYFEQKLEENNYKVLMLTFAGWAHWFSKQPVSKPADLQKYKMWVWKGNSEEALIWKEAGFNPVLLEMNDILTSLSSGMIDALSTTSLTGAANQWFGIAKNMNTMNWSPMLGGLVISNRTWEKIPVKYRDDFMKVMEVVGKRFKQITLDADGKALEVMKANGLKVNTPTAADIQAWQKLVDDNFQTLIDKEMGRDSYNLVKKYVDDYRKENGKH